MKHATLLAIIVFAIFVPYSYAMPPEIPLVSIDTAVSQVVFRVEVAETLEKISRGLMFRENLDSDRGMLFVFPNERRLDFWMKNMLIPLDIIFADSEGKIVAVTTMEPCTEDPCPVFSSPEDSMYVLEINGGLAEAYDIRPGNRIMLHFEPRTDRPITELGGP